ncbi:MAG: YaiI/YqxD family protein [Bacteroidota bacterium]
MQKAQKLAGQYNYEFVTVASFNHLILNENHHVVGDESQAADIAVANLTQPGDIVITQDWGLAALVLGKKARAISPRGRIFTTEQIDLLLEERNLLAKYRKSGGRTKGPAKHSKNDDRLFESNLLKLIVDY